MKNVRTIYCNSRKKMISYKKRHKGRFMIIYEKERSNKNHYIYHQRDNDLNFPVHMHNSFEFIAVLGGELIITVEGKEYTLNKGECAIILPNEAHSYRTHIFSRSYLCVFSTDYVSDFYNKTENMSALDSVFRLEDAENTVNELLQPSNMFALKSTLYRILATFYSSTEFVRQQNGSHRSFVHEVLGFIENHYSEDVTMHDIAKIMGYTYSYFSGLFNRIFKTNFSALLNECRVSYASSLLISTDKTISEIASICGYNSLRVFNRNFFRFKNQTPTEFRKNHGNDRPVMI